MYTLACIVFGNGSQMYANNIRDNTPSFITNNIQVPLSSSSYILTNCDGTNDTQIQLNTMYMQNNNNDNQQQHPQHLLSGSNSSSSLVICYICLFLYSCDL